MSQPSRPRLADAAAVLDAALDRYERLVAALVEQPLTSEKSVRRAARTLGELQESEQQLATAMQQLVATIGTARDAHHARATTVRERAAAIQARSEALAALAERWQALGTGATEVGRLVQSAEAPAAVGGNGEASTWLADIDTRIAALVAEADELERLATESGFDDLARQAESLRLQLHSARNKLHLLVEPRPR